jgi:hypothetical protein
VCSSPSFYDLDFTGKVTRLLRKFTGESVVLVLSQERVREKFERLLFAVFFRVVWFRCEAGAVFGWSRAVVEFIGVRCEEGRF